MRFLVCGGSAERRTSLIGRLLEASKGAPRALVAVDLPGGEDDLRGLAAAAAEADLAIILVDEREGVTAQTRRLTCIVSLLGIRHVVLAADGAVAAEYREFAKHIGLDDVACIAPSRLTALADHLQSVRVVEGRGDRATMQPTDVADQFEATLVWFGEAPMLPGRAYLLQAASDTATATVAPLKHKVNFETFEHMAATKLERGEIGVVQLELERPVAFEPYEKSREHGRFPLLDRVTREEVGTVLIRFALRRAQNVHWQAVDIHKDVRAAMKRQRPCVLWFTGIPSAGKSTIANLVEKRLYALGRHTYLLDGDNVRHGLNKDLGFTEAARVENIRRITEVARLMTDAGLIVLTAFISPFRTERRMARSLLEPGEFFEIFVDTPLAVAEERDPKGLYRKARQGELKNFTGIDSPYEPPEHPEIRIDTTTMTPEAAAERIVEEMRLRGL